jgi:hypothetical protein
MEIKEEPAHSPQALQILLPTSSLRHNGVVLVPQLAQLNALTAARARFVVLVVALASGSFVAGEAASGAAFEEVVSAVGSTGPAGASTPTRPAARALL